MIVHFDHKDKEQMPHNTTCCEDDCKHNKYGYCVGGQFGLSRRLREVNIELDVFHPNPKIPAQWEEELYCTGKEVK